MFSFPLVGLIIGVILLSIAYRRNYPRWEIILWFFAGLIFSAFSIPFFISRVIIETKGLGLGLVSSALITTGTLALMYDVGRVLFGVGFFSRPEFSAISVVGVLLILGGIFLVFTSGRKEKSLSQRLNELDELLSNENITEKEHGEMRKSILS